MAWGVAAALLAGVVWAGDDHPRYTGTFTSMYFDPETGDVVGAEIRIDRTPEGYRGTFRMAMGEPTRPAPIEPVFNGERITFSITDPFDGRSLTFDGRIDARGLRGPFLDVNGDERRFIDLKRAPSYWETQRTTPP